VPGGPQAEDEVVGAFRCLQDAVCKLLRRGSLRAIASRRRPDKWVDRAEQ
jgi:hypothetical protein